MQTAHRKTKIIITLGKASSSVEMLVRLINAGADAVRVTTRFLNSGELIKVLENLKEAEEITGKFVCTILSLREGDIRIGNTVPGNRLELCSGDIIKIVSNRNRDEEPNTIVCNNTSFPNMVKPGDKLLLEFGKAIFTVIDIEELTISPSVRTESQEKLSGPERFKRPHPKSIKAPKVVYCRAENDCILDGQNPLNFLNASNFENHSNNDLEDIRLLEWAKSIDFDVIIYKQVRDREDLESFWTFDIPNGAKRFVGIQTKETAENPEFYLNASEGISIGRGVLGVETSHSQVCLLQKQLVKMCNGKGKPVFLSTQVLESMAINDKPSRAEVVDAYCAVLDGVDALMLTGETAYGKYPELAVKTLHKICVEAEQYLKYKQNRELILENFELPLPKSMGICYLAADSVEKLGASLIICLTKTGKTASILSMFKPSCMIFAITNSLKTLKFLKIVRGIHPILLTESVENTGETERYAVSMALASNLIQPGQVLIFIGSSKDDIIEGSTSSLRVVIAS